MRLGFGLEYQLLHSSTGLQQVDEAFFAYVKDLDAVAFSTLSLYRQAPDRFNESAYSDLILLISPMIESFLYQLFGIEPVESSAQVDDLLRFRTLFVQMKPSPAVDEKTHDALTTWLESHLGVAMHACSEQRLVAFALSCYDRSDEEAVLRLRQWCIHAQTEFVNWYVFWKPKRMLQRLVSVRSENLSYYYQSTQQQTTSRDDFSLIPSYWGEEKTALHVDYCHYCHDRSVDYCRRGFYQKKQDPSQGFRVGNTGLTLAGCPVDEKISQMHWLKHKKFSVAALVACMIDNPFCTVTGHRICNDCMQSCIFQKQEPVDTPQVESRILMDVLNLPWGVEVYDLLLKWNPLRPVEYLPKSQTGRHVLVMGLGPAGFSMMHHLWMQGCHVTGMDGAHLQDWPFGDVSMPIQHFSDITIDLSKRPRMGFGGVCEYGITSRWNKNLLNVVYLSFLRRRYVSMVGNCRFGGGVQVSDVWNWGFDHMVLAVGAGLPTALSIPNSLAPGMVQASDFLMSLHELGVQSRTSLTMLSLQLPCVVIGAGLTAVDCATEAQAYYCQMVQMVYLRLNRLRNMMGEDHLQACFSDREYKKLLIWSEHGERLLDIKKQALCVDETPCFRDVIQAWGGVNIVYRSAIENAQAYKNNHYELQAALDDGIGFFEHTSVFSVMVDGAGSVSGLRCLQPIECASFVMRLHRLEKRQHQYIASVDVVPSTLMAGWILTVFQDCDCDVAIGYLRVVSITDTILVMEPGVSEEPSCLSQDKVYYLSRPQQPINLPAKHVIVATGSMPNTAYEYEHRGHFKRQGGFYALYDLSADGMTLQDSHAHPHGGFFTSYHYGNRRVSVVGDLHPRFHGSVVKALASSQQAVHDVMRHLDALPWDSGGAFEFQPVDMHVVIRGSDYLGQGWHKLVLYAPWLCVQSKPGHLFRFQVPGSEYGNQSMSLQPQVIDPVMQTLTFIFQLSSPLLQQLAAMAVGDRVACMGPTGVCLPRKNLPASVLLLADDLHLPSAWLYHQYFQSQGVEVNLFVKKTDKSQALKNALGIDFQWLLETDGLLQMSPAVVYLHGDFNFVRSHHSALNACARQQSRQLPRLFGLVGGSMHCMLKGICAQCLQWQVDPVTQERTKAVYTCSWQDQPLEIIDWPHAESRHAPCLALERLNTHWHRSCDEKPIF